MFALGAACHLVLLLPCVKKKGQEIASNEIVLVEEEDKTMLPSSNDEEVWLRESFCCFDMYGFILYIWFVWNGFVNEFLLYDCNDLFYVKSVFLLRSYCLIFVWEVKVVETLWTGWVWKQDIVYVNVLITTSVNCYNYLTVCLNGIFLEWSVTGLHDCSKFDLELYKFVDHNNFNLGKQLLRMW